MVREGFVRPLVGARYSLDQIPQALHDLEGRRAVGKLVLDLEAGG
jgi:NADPH:quinone reductase-like Zn-dependent oxidoreductase